MVPYFTASSGLKSSSFLIRYKSTGILPSMVSLISALVADLGIAFISGDISSSDSVVGFVFFSTNNFLGVFGFNS